MGRYKRPLIYLGIIIVTALSLFLLTNCSSDNAADDEIKSEDMKSFASETIYGKAIDSSVFEGHEITMVNFWGTFCGPCIQEMPDLGEIYRDRKGKDFNLVGIVVDVQEQDLSIIPDKLTEAESIISETNADYDHIVVSEDIMSGMMSSYDINSIPATFFVNEEGTVIDGPYLGSRSKAEWEQIIDGVEQ